MQEKFNAIVLNVIKYNDRHNIAHVYSDTRGVLPLLVRQGSTAGSRARNAMFMPLSLLEVVASFRAGNELGRIVEVRRRELLLDLHSHPAKVTIALFIAEVLQRAIVEQERNDQLFAFIDHSVLRLDSAQRGIANFHITFLYQLGRYVGIQPDINTYAPGRWFDLQEGVFTVGVPRSGHALPPDHARAIRLLSRMNYDNMHLFRFTRRQRALLLDTTLAYYRLHQSTLGTLRSLDILKQVFD